MFTFLMIVHVIISTGLILVILTQSSKGGALDGLVGGTATNILGGQGASKLLKNATVILAVLFMLNCILLAFSLKGKTVSSSSSTSAVEKMREQTTEEQATDVELPALPLQEETPVENETE
ncbi:MAG: preprotein translocase subunit SecG [Candidatus Cloacimonadales bacterium]|nr:preprotein translocase subunit SecG [Candidatus Cloacimonadales bacterium]